jgi:hypothetical protein
MSGFQHVQLEVSIPETKPLIQKSKTLLFGSDFGGHGYRSDNANSGWGVFKLCGDFGIEIFGS